MALTVQNSAGNNTCTKNNYINIKPLNADFTANPTWGVAPFSTTFTDASSNSPTAWSWAFGDGGTSTAQNPSHTYSSTGYYSVTLTATNSSGNDTCLKSNYITSCTEVVKYPDSYGVSDMQYVSGTLSSLQSEDSNYMDFHRTSTGKDGLAYFRCQSGYTPSQVCAITYEVEVHSTLANELYLYVAADMTPEIPQQNWEWDNSAGDLPVGTTDGWLTRAVTNMSSYMDSSGLIGVGLCGCTVDSNQNLDYMFNVVRFRLALYPSGGPQPPVANFSGTPTAGAAPLLVNFSDTSSNNPTAWSWTFGDSGTSTAQNPAHTYSSAGSYTVALTATNAQGNNTCTKNNYINVGNPPVANFSGTPTSGNAPLAVNFTDSSTNSPTSWSWTFGDSNTSTAQNPSHTYTSGGSYTVALTATNAYGNNTNTKSNYISVSGGSAPVANFSGTPTSGAAPLAVNFTDSSTNTPTSWSWAFGDSSTSTAQNPSHTYTSAGSYTVALTATNAYGNNTNTKNNYITVGNVPVANFSGTPTSGNAPLAVSFTDSSTNSPTSWSWTFGDSSTSTAQNPSHTYTSTGSYTVALTATNAYGNNTNTKNNYITVNSGSSAPVASFTSPNTAGVAPLSVSFTDTSINTPTAWSWTFGDGGTSTAQNPSHSYSAAGMYTVALTATNSYGNNTCTYTNWVAARSSAGSVTYTPSSMSLGGSCSVVSGALSDTYTENGVYLVGQADPSNLSMRWYFTFSVGYSPSQLSLLRCEMKQHVSRTDTPSWTFFIEQPNSSFPTMASGHWTTSDQWVTYDATTPATYMDTNNQVTIMICSCPTSGNIE